MKTKHFIMFSLLIFLLFGVLTLVLINTPFGPIFNICLYSSISGLLIVLGLGSYLQIKSKSIFIKATGLFTTIITTTLFIAVILLTVDYRFLYFKSPIPKPTKIEWQKDLKYLSSQMRTIHPDIYSMIPKSSLDSLEEEIDTRIPNSDDSDILMDLFKFTAAPNDAHTFPFIFFPCFDMHNSPVQIYGFPDGWYVVDAGREYKKLIGLKVVEIGSVDINDIFAKYPVLLGVENDQSKKERFTYMVVIPEWLKYHKIINNIDQVEFTFEDRLGTKFSKSLPSYKYFPPFLWSNVSKIKNKKPHVYTNPRKDWYQFTPINNSKVLYIEYHQCDNQSGKETVEEFALKLEEHLANNYYGRYIVDLRSNDGGNSNVNRELIRVIRDSKKVNQYGKLFVLIGRRTFSAAVMFANQLQMQTNAILVGEPTSQGPVFYGRPNLVELPNSKLVIGVSSGHTIGGLPIDNRKSIEPDIIVEYTINNFINNEDPVLEIALHHFAEEPIHREILSDNISIEGNYSISPRDFAMISKEDETLYLFITDYVPNSMGRFKSKLYYDGGNEYRTKINGIYLETNNTTDKQIIALNWMETKVELTKLPKVNKFAMKYLMDGEIETGIKEISNNIAFYKDQYKDLEQILNGLGYQLIGEEKLMDAVKVFELNTNIFPKSSNVYDSLAEAYMKSGNRDLAIEFYSRSLELNPKNTNAIDMIDRLKSN